MAERVIKPRVDDFGITEDDLGRAPCLFLAGHRPAVIVAIYLASAVVLFFFLLRVGGSPSAAMFFTVISVTAGSVLLLPFLMLIICASESVEERWLCGRFPKLSACLAYRSALAEYERREEVTASADRTSSTWWSGASTTAFVESTRMEFERAPGGEVIALDRDATGIDFEVKTAAGSFLVRCETGVKPVSSAVGRELVAAVADRGALRALIVTAADVAPALADYIADRPISVVAPWKLDEVMRTFEFRS